MLIMYNAHMKPSCEEEHCNMGLLYFKTKTMHRERKKRTVLSNYSITSRRIRVVSEFQKKGVDNNPLTLRRGIFQE